VGEELGDREVTECLRRIGVDKGEVVRPSNCQTRVKLILVTDNDFRIDSKMPFLIGLEL